MRRGKTRTLAPPVNVEQERERLEKGLCPECGATLVSISSGSSGGVECKACGWSVVTTNHNTPRFDPVRYDIVVDCSPNERLRVIPVVAVLLGRGSDAVRSLIDSGRPVATGLQATALQDTYRRFVQKGVRIRVHPEFPWPLSG